MSIHRIESRYNIDNTARDMDSSVDFPGENLFDFSSIEALDPSIVEGFRVLYERDVPLEIRTQSFDGELTKPNLLVLTHSLTHSLTYSHYLWYHSSITLFAICDTIIHISYYLSIGEHQGQGVSHGIKWLATDGESRVK